MGLPERLAEINSRVTEITSNFSNFINQLNEVQQEAQRVSAMEIPVPQIIQQPLAPARAPEAPIIPEIAPPEAPPLPELTFEEITAEQRGPYRTRGPRFIPTVGEERYPEFGTLFPPTEEESRDILERVQAQRTEEIESIEQSFQTIEAIGRIFAPITIPAAEDIEEDIQSAWGNLLESVSGRTDVIQRLEGELERLRAPEVTAGERPFGEAIVPEEEEEEVVRLGRRRRGILEREEQRRRERLQPKVEVNINITAETITSADLIDKIKDEVGRAVDEQIKRR